MKIRSLTNKPPEALRTCIRMRIMTPAVRGLWFAADSRKARRRGRGRALDVSRRTVSRETEMACIDRFPRIHDPEGNAIERWEPAS